VGLPVTEIRLIGGAFDGYRREPDPPLESWPEALFVVGVDPSACANPSCEGVHLHLRQVAGALYYRFAFTDEKGAAYEFGHIVEPDGFLAGLREREMVTA
jgi:hypothetical protein